MALAQRSDSSSLPVGDLKTRWLATTPEGTTRRDLMLQHLQGGDRLDVEPQLQMVDLRGINLVGEDLSNCDLSNCDLSDADLSNCNLTRAKLIRSRLCKTTLYRTILNHAELLSADLSDATCNECEANQTGFGAANLGRANFFGAQMQNATLSQAQLRDADFRTANLQGCRIRQADLTGATFASADLSHADLSGSHVQQTIFDSADLSEIQLPDIQGYETASWVRTDIRQVDFRGAYMVRRHIMDENFLHEFRHRGKSYELIYQAWRITSDCGRSMTRWSLCTASIAVIFAFLFMVVEVDYGDHKNFFSPLYYSIVTLTTLGYGDVLPKSPSAQILATVEVILGYLSGGGLISIFSNKIARRAE